MDGFSPKLPLQSDLMDGNFLMNKTSKEAIKQNFKNILLTEPGERVMFPSFGVGLRRFLFEQKSLTNIQAIKTRIISQLSDYLPYVTLTDVIVTEKFQTDENLLSVQVIYYIPALNTQDEIIV